MIRGKISKLRAIEAGDVKNYHHWINDQETNQWRGLYHPTSKEEANKWIQEQRTKSPDHLSLSLAQKDGTHIGFIGLRAICPRSRRAEIWIYIGSKKHWNQGIGFDATLALCEYAFDQMNLYRIWLECNPKYKPVVKCYKKIGFVREGILRKAYYRHGKFRDTSIMGLLREDFQRTSKKRGRK
jgi:RimJ/RimL family protein N-acetyltransferase